MLLVTGAPADDPDVEACLWLPLVLCEALVLPVVLELAPGALWAGSLFEELMPPEVFEGLRTAPADGVAFWAIAGAAARTAMTAGTTRYEDFIRISR